MRFIQFLLLFYMIPSSSFGQLEKGNRLVGTSLSINYSRTMDTYYDFVGKKRNTDERSISPGVTYGKFVADNKAKFFSVQYAVTVSDDRTEYKDSFNTTNASHSQQNSIHANLGTSYFYPWNNKFGFYVTERKGFIYNNRIYSSSFYGGIPSNEISLSGYGDIGFYCLSGKKLMLMLEINLVGLELNYRWTKGTDRQGQYYDSKSVSINTTGTISPNFSFNDIQFGARYILEYVHKDK